MYTIKTNEYGHTVSVKEIGGGDGYTLYLSKDGASYYSLDDGSDQVFKGEESDAISLVSEYQED